MSEPHIELHLLKIRNAVAEKERCIACANQELAQGGWRSDWNLAFLQCDKDIEFLIDQFHKL